MYKIGDTSFLQKMPQRKTGFINQNKSEKPGKEAQQRFLLQELERQDTSKNSYAYLQQKYQENNYYAQMLQEQRLQKKDTLQEMKKLQYSFKAVSTQILRSKTSMAAKQAANKARAEVARLKRLRQAGVYDSEELDCAIAHAKAMERVAKKKAKHLMQEEMVKVEEQEPTQNDMVDFEDPMEDKIQKLQQLIEEMSAEKEDFLWENVAMYEELMELDFSLLEAVDPVMNEEEFQMFQIKHRNREMKELVEADMEYLKGMFEKMMPASMAEPVSAMAVDIGL